MTAIPPTEAVIKDRKEINASTGYRLQKIERKRIKARGRMIREYFSPANPVLTPLIARTARRQSKATFVASESPSTLLKMKTPKT